MSDIHAKRFDRGGAALLLLAFLGFIGAIGYLFLREVAEHAPVLATQVVLGVLALITAAYGLGVVIVNLEESDEFNWGPF